MGYPFRIERPAAIVAQAGTPASPLQEYVDRLIRLIPAEVLAAYQTVRGVVVSVVPTSASAKSFLPWLPVIGFILVLLVRAWGTRAPTGSWMTVQWGAVAVAAVSFVILIISLGHPIVVQTAIETWIGSVLLIFWVFLLPYLYKGE